MVSPLNPIYETLHIYLICFTTTHTDFLKLFLQMGPFIDSDHPDIKKGTVDQSFRDIFHFEILRKVGAAEDFILEGCKIHLSNMCLFDTFVQLQDFTQYLGHHVRVILIPSVRDAHHDFVFPQVCSFSHSERTNLI